MFSCIKKTQNPSDSMNTKKRDVLPQTQAPDLHIHSQPRPDSALRSVKTSRLVKSKFTQNFVYVSNEAKLMRQVNSILNNKNTINLVRSRLKYSSENLSKLNEITSADFRVDPKIKLKLNILAINPIEFEMDENVDPNTSYMQKMKLFEKNIHASVLKEYDVVEPHKPQFGKKVAEKYDKIILKNFLHPNDEFENINPILESRLNLTNSSRSLGSSSGKIIFFYQISLIRNEK